MVKFTFAFKSFNSPTFCNNSKINLKKKQKASLALWYSFSVYISFQWVIMIFCMVCRNLIIIGIVTWMVDVQKKSLLFDIHLHNRFDENTSKSAETHIWNLKLKTFKNKIKHRFTFWIEIDSVRVCRTQLSFQFNSYPWVGNRIFWLQQKQG